MAEAEEPESVAVSPPQKRVRLCSLQNTSERVDSEIQSASGNYDAASSRSKQDKPSQADGGGSREPGLSSSVSSTASGTLSTEGGQQGYLKNLPRHKRRRIEQEMRRKRRPGRCVLMIIYVTV